MHKKELITKIVAMPRDTNPAGQMFGGWIVSQMDCAGYLHACKHTKERLVTVAIDKLVFHKPVAVGDCVICYGLIEKIGHTSITVHVEVTVERRQDGREEKVTEGNFVFVAIGQDHRPVAVSPL